MTLAVRSPVNPYSAENLAVPGVSNGNRAT